MSDTTNVMKGTRSGVQKPIRIHYSHVFDVGCICHLADLAVKSGMGVLPVDIDQFFVDVFYYFYHSSKTQNFVTSGVLYLQVSLKQSLSIELLSGSVYCIVLIGIFLSLMV